jgi:uncharacterized membrane protein HdeD (DUF308 family)
MNELGPDAGEMVKRMGRRTLVPGIEQIVLGLLSITLARATTTVTVAILAVISAVTGTVDFIDFAGSSRARSSWRKRSRGVPVLSSCAGSIGPGRKGYGDLP